MAILPPSVNKSAVEFEPEGNGIRYALAALKNMGQSAAEHIVAERGAKPSAISPISCRASIPRR